MTKEQLEKQAEELYPMPITSCRYMKMRCEWLRKRWVSSQMGIQILAT